MLWGERERLFKQISERIKVSGEDKSERGQDGTANGDWWEGRLLREGFVLHYGVF